MVYGAALVTHPGFEDIAIAEVGELIGAGAKAAAEGVIAFSVTSPEELCRLCYLSQSANDIFILKKAAGAGNPLKGAVRVSPFSLVRREYEVFGKSDGITGSLAYLLLRASGYTGREFVFDPFTRSGAIAVEAAVFSSGFPVNYYRKDAIISSLKRLPQFSKVDFAAAFSGAGKKVAKAGILSSSQLMQNVRFAEKNARIAGVNKLIRFSRLDIGWLDAKLDDGSVDLVVSFPPRFRAGGGSFAAVENERLLKMYKDFFCHAAYFMNRSGKIALVLARGSREIYDIAAGCKFKPAVLREFQVAGRDWFELVSFSKA